MIQTIYDRLQRLYRTVMGKPRLLYDHEYHILLTIGAHPECMPTWSELRLIFVEVGDKLSEEDVDEAITTLSNAGLVQPVTAKRSDGRNVSMYGLTEDAVDFLQIKYDMDGAREDYSRLDIDSMDQHESIPRPDLSEYSGLYVPNMSHATSSNAEEVRP